MSQMIPFTRRPLPPANVIRRCAGRDPREPVPGRPRWSVALGDAVLIPGRCRADEPGHVVALAGDRATVQTDRARVVCHPDRLRPLGLVEELAP